MNLTTTQFIWKQALAMSAFPPPEPKGKRPRFGSDADCWLCGGATEQQGWPLSEVVGSAFTDSPSAKAAHSASVCQSCAALMKKEAWVPACEKFGHPPYFPVKDEKTPFLSSWMFSSHVFSVGRWLRPNRAEARAALLDLPPPPFVIALAEVGKKHILFRAPISLSREHYFVQLDEMTLSIDAARFASVLCDFESAYCAGLSKESLLTGQYNQAAALALGLQKWRAIETTMSGYRKTSPDELALAAFCAQKLET